MGYIDIVNCNQLMIPYEIKKLDVQIGVIRRKWLVDNYSVLQSC